MAAPAKPSRRRLAIGTYIGMALCVLITGLWLVSGWSRISWGYAPNARLRIGTGLDHGQLYLAWVRPPNIVMPTGLQVELDPRTGGGPNWRLWFEYMKFGPYTFTKMGQVVRIPLWAPLIVAAVPTVILWRRLRRPTPGVCHCGYSLEGIMSGVCPECGVRHAQA